MCERFPAPAYAADHVLGRFVQLNTRHQPQDLGNDGSAGAQDIFESRCRFDAAGAACYALRFLAGRCHFRLPQLFRLVALNLRPLPGPRSGPEDQQAEAAAIRAEPNVSRIAAGGAHQIAH